MKLIGFVNRTVSGVVILLVRAYQIVISPHFGSCCRFEPSCSVYCIEALRSHGILKGGWLTLKRLLRCRPFGPSGYDPVPQQRHPDSGKRILTQRRKDAEGKM